MKAQEHFFILLFALAVPLGAADDDAHQPWQEPPASAEEPLAKKFSAQLAAQSLDTSARLWQRDNQCVQCHANMLHGLARPLLDHLAPMPPDYRGLLTTLVTERWTEKGLDNLVWGGATGLPANPELVASDPLLAADPEGILRPAAGSPVVDAAATQALLAGDLLDLDGALRPLTGRDIGADELFLGARPVAPLSTVEAGPLWMKPAGPLDLWPALTPVRRIRISIRSPGTAWARLLTLFRAAALGGPWNVVPALAEADDDGLFTAVEDPAGFERLALWHRPGRLPLTGCKPRRTSAPAFSHSQRP